MPGVNQSEPQAVPKAVGVDAATLGVGLCFFSAFVYATANVCLRSLTANNPIWAICVKESVSVAVVGPWLVSLAICGVRVLPPWRSLGALVLAGLATQLGGNVLMQWALGVIGLAVTIPICVGVNLVTSALVGWLVLGEWVSRRSMAAIALLILAICCLSLGAGTANQVVAQDTPAEVGPLWAALGVAATCLAGAIFAGLAITIRKTVTSAVSPAVVVLVITGMGPLTWGPLSYWQLGPDALWATPPDQFRLMLLAGLLNLIAFFSLTKGLQTATVVFANVVSASQTALAAVAGMFLFREPPNPALVVGVALTIVGLMLRDRPDRGVEGRAVEVESV